MAWKVFPFPLPPASFLPPASEASEGHCLEISLLVLGMCVAEPASLLPDGELGFSA